jgi:hypothetical protein
MLSFAATATQNPANLAAISALLASLGLSSTAGIRAYLPLFAVGLASNANILHLQSRFSALGAAGPLVLLGILMVGEFTVDKLPIIDHVSDFVHTFIRPLSGAAIMAGTQNSLSDKSGLAAAVVGGGLALAFHGVKAASRPVVSATTVGMGNPIVSLLEDVFVVVAVLLLILAPFIGFGIFVLMIVGIWRLLRRFLRLFRRRKTPTPANPVRVVEATPNVGRKARKGRAAAVPAGKAAANAAKGAAGGAAAAGALGAAALGAAALGAGAKTPAQSPISPPATPVAPANAPNAAGNFGTAPTQGAPTVPTAPAQPPYAPGGGPLFPAPHSMKNLPTTQPMPGQPPQPGQPAQPGGVYPPDATTLPGTLP